MQYILVCGPNIEWITFAAPTKMTSIVGKHELGVTNGKWRMVSVISLTIRHWSLATQKRRGVRVVDRARLESVCTERYRGFESRPLRRVSTAETRKIPKRPANTTFAGLFNF